MRPKSDFEMRTMAALEDAHFHSIQAELASECLTFNPEDEIEAFIDVFSEQETGWLM